MHVHAGPLTVSGNMAEGATTPYTSWVTSLPYGGINCTDWPQMTRTKGDGGCEGEMEMEVTMEIGCEGKKEGQNSSQESGDPALLNRLRRQPRQLSLPGARVLAL
jgi:hypothetical protein